MIRFIIALVLVISNSVMAKWTVIEGVAVLHSTVTIEDSTNVPVGDHIESYLIDSPGGSVVGGREIIRILNDVWQPLKKPIFYSRAYSIAGIIAINCNAIPVDDDAVLGFHWAYIPGAGPTTMSEFIHLQKEWEAMKRDILKSNQSVISIPYTKRVLILKLMEIRYENQAGVIVTISTDGTVEIVR
jgi:hypothetical protein